MYHRNVQKTQLMKTQAVLSANPIASEVVILRIPLQTMRALLLSLPYFSYPYPFLLPTRSVRETIIPRLA